MKKPTDAQRLMFAQLGLRCPETRAEASEEQARLRSVVQADRVSSEAYLLVEEYKHQIADLRRLVRYQKLDIARLKVGD